MARDEEDDGPTFPTGVRAAGVIWIVFGALGLVFAAVSIVLGAARNNTTGPNACCTIAFSVAFLVIGIQTVKGATRDVLGNGIGSLVFGLIYFGVAVLALASVGFAGPGGAGFRGLMVALAVFCGVFGAMLLTAGALALMHRTAYRAWREVNAPSPRRRRPEREDEEEDENRPRRRNHDDER